MIVLLNQSIKAKDDLIESQEETIKSLLEHKDELMELVDTLSALHLEQEG